LARVAVNRLWETLFGRGIVETAEDFGSQGSPPGNQQLLDHLAARYVELGWSTKKLLREIVLSATYRQSAAASESTLKRDPENLLWSRSPRYRLEAEAIRDSALAVSGLLSDRKFGPSVMPPQPDGIWQIVYSNDRWTIYTFWRRSSPYPSMMAFDAPSRETCTVRRIRSDSPLAALVTMNDPVWMEAARGLAQRGIDAGGDEQAIAARILRVALARPALDEEVKRLVELHRADFERLSGDPTATRAIAESDDVALAAWTLTASVVLSLDEFLSRT
jgi:hypothetical protein